MASPDLTDEEDGFVLLSAEPDEDGGFVSVTAPATRVSRTNPTPAAAAEQAPLAARWVPLQARSHALLATLSCQKAWMAALFALVRAD